MGASWSTDGPSVTIDKKVIEIYTEEHKSTVQKLQSVKDQLVSLQANLQSKQMELNTESNQKNALQRELSTVRTNLLEIEGEKAELSVNLETVKWDLNQLRMKYNFLSDTNEEISKQRNAYKLTSADKDKQLEKTMIELIQTKSDLKKVSQRLSEEIENKKGEPELENKYRSLEESNNKLEKDLRESRDEFDKIKAAFIKYMHENRVLREKCEVYDEDVKKLNGDLSETKLELDNVKLENKKLHTSNTNLGNELKEVKQDRSALKEEISKREKAITRHKNTIAKLKNELHQGNNKYLELKEKSTKEDVTDETLRKIIQIYHRIQDLQRGITEKTNIFVKEINENDRNEKEKLIETLKSDYDNCGEKLESKGININRTQFIDIHAKYKHLCQRNDDNKKNLFKLVYEMEKFVKDLRKKFDTFSENLNKDVEKAGTSERDLNTNLLMQGFTAEEELYRDVVRIVKEEIAYREKLLNVDVEVVNDNRFKVKDCNVLNNGKPHNSPPQIPQTQQDANSTEDSNKKSKAVILFGAPDTSQSDYEDHLMISMFLEKHEIDYKFFRCRRFKKGKNGARPLVIEFTNEETVEKIMELGQQKNWFLGFNPLVKVFIENKQR